MSKKSEAFIGKNPVAKRNRRNMFSILAVNMGVMFFYSIVSSYISFYYTDIVLLSAAAVSAVLSITIIVDGVTDFLMGAVIDHIQTKYGKVRHWFLWMSIPTAVATALIFFCPSDWSNTAKTVYLFIIYNVYSIFLTTVRLPSRSMVSLSFNDPDTRGQAGIIGAFAGNFGSAIVSTLVAPLLAALGGGALAYKSVSIGAAGVGILLLLLGFAILKEVVGSKAAIKNVRETEGDAAADFLEKTLKNESIDKEGKNKKGSVLKDIALLLRNKYWVIKAVATLFNALSIGFLLGTATYFCQYVIGDFSAVGGIFGVMSIGMLIGIICASPIMLKFDSRIVAVIGSIVACAGMVVAAVGILALGNLPALYAGIAVKQVGSGLSIAADMDLTARTIDYGEWRFGRRLDGLAYSGGAVLDKITAAAATAIFGLVLTLTGYVGGTGEISAAATSALTWMFLVIPAITLALAGVAYGFFNLSNKKILEMRDEIRVRAESAQ